MSFDLIVKGGILPDGRKADIAISGQKIAAIEPRLDAEAGRVIDAENCLVSPPFVDPHFHMDATLSYGIPRINASGTLLEGIALVVFGSWRPGKALLGAILFAAFDAYQVRLQQLSGGAVPYQVFLMLPYVLSIAALVLMARRAAYPRALMVPYRKGER